MGEKILKGVLDILKTMTDEEFADLVKDTEENFYPHFDVLEPSSCIFEGFGGDLNWDTDSILNNPPIPTTVEEFTFSMAA